MQGLNFFPVKQLILTFEQFLIIISFFLFHLFWYMLWKSNIRTTTLCLFNDKLKVNSDTDWTYFILASFPWYVYNWVNMNNITYSCQISTFIIPGVDTYSRHSSFFMNPRHFYLISLFINYDLTFSFSGYLSVSF